MNGSATLSVDCTKGPNDCVVCAAGACGPLMPIGTKTVHLHSNVDHQIVETIFNNRTAMVTYTSPRSATVTSIELFGTTSTIEASITSY